MPGTPNGEAVEHEIENLRSVYEVAAERELLKVDAQHVDAPEARRRAFQRLEVCRAEISKASARVRRHHDDVSGIHVEVQGERAAALMHVLDEVLADPAEAQQGAPAAAEAVAREDEEHDVQEELGEGGGGVLVRVVHALGWWDRQMTPRVFL